MSVWISWAILAAIFLIAEITTFTVYLLWLCAGAIAACIVSLFVPDMVWLQILIGALVSLVLIIYGKPIVARLRYTKDYTDKSLQLVGQVGYISEKIEPEALGQVKVGADTWTARATEELDVGQKVSVIEQTSTILTVCKYKEEI